MGVGHFARECPEGDGGRDVGRGGYGGDSGGFGGGSHREGLSQCGDEDLLQVRRYWSHLEGVPQRQPGLVEPRRHKTSHLAKILYLKDLQNSQQQVQEQSDRLPNNYLVNIQNHDSDSRKNMLCTSLCESKIIILTA